MRGMVVLGARSAGEPCAAGRVAGSDTGKNSERGGDAGVRLVILDIGGDQLGCIEELVGVSKARFGLRLAAGLCPSRVSSCHLAAPLERRLHMRSVKSMPARVIDCSLRDAMIGSLRRTAALSWVGESSCSDA